MTKRKLTIATRESPLAIQQAELVKRALIAHYPHLAIDLLGITTEADKNLAIPLYDIGGKGLFVKELEDALYDGRADVAVHSVKDVPMILPSGLLLPVILPREDARDAFISNHYASLAQLPSGAVLGTSSLRRLSQIKALRPDIAIAHLRGNVNTRLKRLDQEEFAAIILAGAGLKRLGLLDRIRSYLPIDECLPAAGQGALGIECREDDEGTKKLIAPLNDVKSQACIDAERALARQLGGGCKVPVAAYATLHHDELHLKGLVANKNGSKILRADRRSKQSEAEGLGKRVAKELLDQGAAKILEEFYD